MIPPDGRKVAPVGGVSTGRARYPANRPRALGCSVGGSCVQPTTGRNGPASSVLDCKGNPQRRRVFALHDFCHCAFRNANLRRQRCARGLCAGEVFANLLHGDTVARIYLFRKGEFVLQCRFACANVHLRKRADAHSAGDRQMARKPQMTQTQMQQVAEQARGYGYSAQVTKNGRHVIAIKAPAWLEEMKANIAARA